MPLILLSYASFSTNWTLWNVTDIFYLLSSTISLVAGIVYGLFTHYPLTYQFYRIELRLDRKLCVFVSAINVNLATHKDPGYWWIFFDYVTAQGPLLFIKHEKPATIWKVITQSGLFEYSLIINHILTSFWWYLKQPTLNYSPFWWNYRSHSGIIFSGGRRVKEMWRLLRIRSVLIKIIFSRTKRTSCRQTQGKYIGGLRVKPPKRIMWRSHFATGKMSIGLWARLKC